MRRLAIVSHAALVGGKDYDGIGDVLVEALDGTTFDYYVLHHSIDGDMASVVRTYRGKDIQRSSKLWVPRKPSPLRYASEIVSTVFYFTFCKKVDVYIGLDPLNALAGVLLKKLRRVKYCVFYTPDYSPQRFASSALNNVYHRIDRYCVREADEVWSVSPRIYDVRRKMGLPEDKNVLMPNVLPSMFARMRTSKHDEQALVTTGILEKQIDFAGAIRTVAKLHEKYPKMTLTLIGDGPEKPTLEKLAAELDVAQNVHLVGRLPHIETMSIVAKSGIGLALYNGNWAFNTFGDSSKCREFSFFGLPIISTDVHATVPEIVAAKAGVIVEQNVEQYVQAVETILANYEKYAAASASLGKRYDDIHRKQLMRILEPHGY